MTHCSIMPKDGIHDWSFCIRLIVYPFLVKLNLLLMPFLIIYAMCNYISIVMDAMFWCSGACCCIAAHRGVW
jgi:hypothetical protein